MTTESVIADVRAQFPILGPLQVAIGPTGGWASVLGWGYHAKRCLHSAVTFSG